MGNPVALSLELTAEYLKRHNFDRADYVPFSYQEAVRSADAYENMVSDPRNKEVKQSYEAFIAHIINQFILLHEKGFQFISNSQFDYPTSEALREDIRQGKMIYLPTESNGGTYSEIPEEHPLAESFEVEDQRYYLNDIFRIVHDFYGHGIGHSFSPKGEHEAWNAHRLLLPREAHLAIWCETRGQSSWVNFGRHIRDSKENIHPADRSFAQQKCGIPLLALDLI